MGDRTTVNLVVRKVDFQSNQSLFKEPDINEDYSETFLSLEYYEINYANLDFESVLQDNRIPYDKHWDDGSQYCRILANGSVVIKEFDGDEEAMVCLDEAISAFKNGSIGAFLETKKNEKIVMSWADQEVIMKGRDIANASLLNLDQESLDELVVEMSCDTSYELNEADSDDTQEEAILIAEKQASDINNQGKEKQISYLLNCGYLSEGVNVHNIAPYKLLESSLTQNDKQLSFELRDDCGSEEQDITGYVDNGINLGIALHFNGYSDYCSTDDNGTPVYIEKYDGDLRVIVYSDINQEDPTHVISLEGARNEKRTKE